ncbi:hypothetical protein SDC9_58732 [bioreactor metagenome]|uniref:Uncharacterized protein n=1 Tax=bioreactor metagenome TaxID=1076179 RepID=A0A644X8I2_9ZZZZ
MGCEGHHGDLVVQHRRPGVPDEGSGFVAVHLGHLNVHEHEVEPFPGQVFHRFAAIGGGFRKKSSLFQKQPHKFPVHPVVIHHEN